MVPGFWVIWSYRRVWRKAGKHPLTINLELSCPHRANNAFTKILRSWVVSIGTIPTFKADLVPYDSDYTPLFYVINICLYLAKRNHFFGSRFYNTIDIYILRDAQSIDSIYCCRPFFTQKVQQKYWWRIVKKTKSGTKSPSSKKQALPGADPINIFTTYDKFTSVS